MRVVIDSNVFVSALLTKGNCLRILSLLKNDKFALISSDLLLKEMEFVLKRPKFRKFIKAHERKEFILLLKTKAIFVTPVIKIDICRDIADNKLIEVAVAGRASYLITGDLDLLSIKDDVERKFSVKVVSPAKFLEIIKSG